jgi:hypothetical protein
VCPHNFAVCRLVCRWCRREPLKLGSVAEVAIAIRVVIMPRTARNRIVTGHPLFCRATFYNWKAKTRCDDGV